MLDLHSAGAFSLWEWDPRTDQLRTYGALTADSLRDWMTRIHPRDQASFSEFLDRDWTPAPPFLSLDYRFNVHRQHDWVRIRHTAGLVQRGDERFLAGLVEELSSPSLSRTLLERTENELREGEHRTHRFIDEALPLESHPDPSPLLDMLRLSLRADTVLLLEIDDCLRLRTTHASNLDAVEFPLVALREPLANALFREQAAESPRIIDLDLESGGAGISYFLVKPLFHPDHRISGALCAGFRTGAARLVARRYQSLMSLGASLAGRHLGREASEGLREDLLAQLCSVHEGAQAGRVSRDLALDLQNFLSHVLSQLKSLDDAFESGDWKKWRESLDLLRKKSTSAADVTNRLLQLGPTRNSSEGSCDLNRVVERFVAMMRRVLENSIEFRLDLHPGLASVQVDDGTVRELLLNLILDARAAMPNGGVIKISTHPASRSGEDRRYAALQVSDQGTPGRVGRIAGALEPVFFEDSDLKGRGLGLYHTATLVAEQGGWFETEGERGPGNTLRILLPALASAVENAPLFEPVPHKRGKSSANSYKGATVLLVEDELAVRKLARKALEVLGCTVIEAVTGREALDLWPNLRDRVTLVVSDVVMPEGVSGWDLARELHHRHPDLGILLTSGYNETPQDQGLGGINRIEFLQKPYPVSALKASLARLTQAATA